MIRISILCLGMALALLTPIATMQAAENPQLKTVVLDVPGMTCKFCPITVRKALQKVPGVVAAKSDYDSKTATVTYDPAKTTLKALTEATANAGYESRIRQERVTSDE
ncbi:MAG TPA: mercury resistance system periplasmic binding protein MerP [Chromatiales bacterium]|nr:mercury resistance system periplasmic binding protein MerP [Chromatiales bacterium]